jgi:hypothetical protein
MGDIAFWGSAAVVAFMIFLFLWAIVTLVRGILRRDKETKHR